MLLTGQPIEERAPFKALGDVNFSIEPGEVVGIIGHNGSSKRTMFKLLANIQNSPAAASTSKAR
ncbi:MAG: ATP-binding cassette domain-containing protein [Candidatus Nitrotoga sp.]|nr:ATP-binding cassette domain-containing protein [Candidatus Nitrotoga sp.]